MQCLIRGIVIRFETVVLDVVFSTALLALAMWIRRCRRIYAYSENLALDTVVEVEPAQVPQELVDIWSAAQRPLLNAVQQVTANLPLLRVNCFTTGRGEHAHVNKHLVNTAEV